ncbi:MAG: carbohydrate binding family 9 domain-containing protein [Gemmatimonadales bacterium]|nr:carbohydrate binding family 9 domain-containing protein [Gemmatimonadales bacterium]
MTLPVLLLAMTLGVDTLPKADPTFHHGRSGLLQVPTPRLEGEVTIDGQLTEPMWREAAILTGFSQYTPVDGAAAADSTEVYIWYSATALHIGVRAFAPPGTINATLADRDRIGSDDNIQVFLSTFNDGRQATWFAVNPLGVQADGALNESGRGGGCGGFNCAESTRQGPDLSQDFVWQSKGRLTPEGYEVEIRIPFKSIRFQQARSQVWGINILRVVQRSGQEQTWTPTKRAGTSFLTQSGQLTGLTELDPGLVLDIVPTLTSRVDGAAAAGDGSWNYGGGKPDIGGNVRFGVTPNLTLNATANPDFSQVESDAGQFAFDPRQAIRFAERRPFFLDGIEQFDAPGGLIYTRRIVQPVFATKLTGRVSGTQVGVLAAVDDDAVSRSGEHPLFGILRASREIAPGSRIGFLWTEQRDGDENNRVLDLDGSIVLNRIHAFSFQGAWARDERAGATLSAPMWNLGYRRNGRGFRARYGIDGIDGDFRTRTGLIGRTDYAHAIAAHSYTWLREKKTMESISAELVLDATWQYADFGNFSEIQDRKLHFNVNTRWKGGWTVGASILDENFGYDPSIYTNYRLLAGDGSLLPFTGTPRIPNRDYLVTVGSPAFQHVSFNVFTLWGKDENFFEWASGDIIWVQAGMLLRPTNQVRLNLSYNHQQVNRPGDGSRVSLQIVPRARLEYQISRAFQVRLVSQYALETRDSLRDDSRTGLPIVFAGQNGTFTRAAAFRDGRLRTDVLFSYLPNPGTVVYFGYGASHVDQVDEVDVLRRSGARRTNDGLFLKLSYLWRVK